MVISAILPDQQMPIVDGKTCECIMNPYSTINRKFCDNKKILIAGSNKFIKSAVFHI